LFSGGKKEARQELEKRGGEGDGNSVKGGLGQPQKTSHQAFTQPIPGPSYLELKGGSPRAQNGGGHSSKDNSGAKGRGSQVLLDQVRKNKIALYGQRRTVYQSYPMVQYDSKKISARRIMQRNIYRRGPLGLGANEGQGGSSGTEGVKKSS